MGYVWRYVHRVWWCMEVWICVQNYSAARICGGMSRDCKDFIDVVVPMHKWSEILGHEKVDKLLERRKAGRKVEVKFRHYCVKCSACKAYLKDLGVVGVTQSGYSGEEK
mmetsp:Transcript_5221/g.7702  ORF Transcript_5221/g.7702 Transcript_5221/m.7702 type:complete len:109 (+) Transcript_5221:2252-2578(+)